jgi:hypothetical protein
MSNAETARPTSMDVTTWTLEQLAIETEAACSAVEWAVVYMGRESDTYIGNRDSLGYISNEWLKRVPYGNVQQRILGWLDTYQRSHQAAYDAAA